MSSKPTTVKGLIKFFYGTNKTIIVYHFAPGERNLSDADIQKLEDDGLTFEDLVSITNFNFNNHNCGIKLSLKEHVKTLKK